MGICGGGGGSGYTTSQTTNEPWEAQKQPLRDLFAAGLAGNFGINNKGESVGKNAPAIDWFKGQYPDALGGGVVPGKMEFVGDRYDMWKDFDMLEGSKQGLGGSQLQMTNAPTVAGFSPEEIVAQNIIKNRAQGKSTWTDDFSNSYNTGYNTLIPQAQTALGKVVSGTNKVNPASFSAASIASPSTINNPSIGTPDSFQTPTIGSTDLGYNYWDELGQMAGGKSNSYLEDMISNAKENIWSDYNNYAVPGLNTTAEEAGRYGGNTWKELRSDLYDKTSKNAGQVETAMRGNAYDTRQSNALAAMGLGGTLAGTQAGFDSDRATQQAAMEMERRAKEYDTNAAAKQLMGQLGLQAETAQSGNELTRGIQNALLSQEANREGAGFTQQANVQNVANILQGAPIAPGVSQSDYEDIAKLAAVGESQGAKQQDIIDAFVDRFNFNQNEPNLRMANVSNLFAGDLGGTSISTAPKAGGGCF